MPYFIEYEKASTTNGNFRCGNILIDLEAGNLPLYKYLVIAN